MATTQELIDYYANLLIIQYLGQPKAYATIQNLVKPVIMDQLPVAVQDAFSLDTAVGVQLDVIGKYVGVTRTGMGFDGPIVLNDADFRVLIKVAIITNQSGSSLYDIQNILHIFFPGSILVFDYQDMRMSYLIDSDIGSQDLIQLFVTEGLLPKPMGVQLAAPIYTTDLQFFGMLSAEMIKVYSDQFSVTIDQAAVALSTKFNIWQFNSVDTPILGQWLSAKQGIYNG